MPNFSSILDRKASTIEEPKPFPVGTYLVLLQGQPIRGESSQKKTEYWDFPSKILQPQSDVSQEEIEKFGGVQGKELKGRGGLRFYITEESAYRMKEFLTEHLGIDEGEKTMREMLAEAPGKQVYVTISHQPSDDGKRIYSQVVSTARV
jgi:hypothetical protein